MSADFRRPPSRTAKTAKRWRGGAFVSFGSEVHGPPQKIDFKQVGAIALANAEALLQEWLPDGKRRGREWVARNPTRSDSHAGSFSINMGSGIWSDFASGESGSDLTSLLAYLQGSSQLEAAKEITQRLGQHSCSHFPPVPSRHRFRIDARQDAAKTDKRVSVPKGSLIPPEAIRHPRLGEPVATWEYCDASGRPLGYACRFEPDGQRKQVLPFSWDGNQWAWRAMPEPRPLFKLPDIVGSPQSIVLLVEGEKASCAAKWMAPELAVTTWAGGAAAWRKTDWRPLAGRNVILWPDADEPGKNAMRAIYEHLVWTIGAKVRLIELPSDLPSGWDAADLLQGDPAGHRRMLIAVLAGRCTTYAEICASAHKEAGRIPTADGPAKPTTTD